MVEIPILDLCGDAGAAVERVAEELGLRVTSDGSLRIYPGSRHWHLKSQNRSGTLEITLWPQGNRFWVTYHSNRVGDGWVVRAALEMAARLAEVLGGRVDRSDL